VQNKGAPELIHAVDQGKLSVSQAAIAARLDRVQQVRVVEKAEAGDEKAARTVIKEHRRQGAQTAYGERIAAGGTVDDLHRLAASGFRAGAILADPPWRFETWSDNGRDRSADAHYATTSFDAIKALPIAELATDDCALFLWCLDTMLPATLDVIAAWDFRFVNVGLIWVKTSDGSTGLDMGLGYWTRRNAELCLFATRGKPSRLSRDVNQVIFAPPTRHSAKPAEPHERIERLVPGPYLELYARQSRDNWATWGNEIAATKGEELPPIAGAATTNVAPAVANRAMPPAVEAGDDLLDIPTFLRRGHPDCPIGAAPLSAGEPL
jgi:N6-adenosine-specific RNA methylase IME4